MTGEQRAARFARSEAALWAQLWRRRATVVAAVLCAAGIAAVTAWGDPGAPATSWAAEREPLTLSQLTGQYSFAGQVAPLAVVAASAAAAAVAARRRQSWDAATVLAPGPLAGPATAAAVHGALWFAALSALTCLAAVAVGAGGVAGGLDTTAKLPSAASLAGAAGAFAVAGATAAAGWLFGWAARTSSAATGTGFAALVVVVSSALSGALFGGDERMGSALELAQRGGPLGITASGTWGSVISDVGPRGALLGVTAALVAVLIALLWWRDRRLSPSPYDPR